MTLKVTDNQYTVGYPSDSWASCLKERWLRYHSVPEASCLLYRVRWRAHYIAAISSMRDRELLSRFRSRRHFLFTVSLTSYFLLYSSFVWFMSIASSFAHYLCTSCLRKFVFFLSDELIALYFRIFVNNKCITSIARLFPFFQRACRGTITVTCCVWSMKLLYSEPG